MKDSSALEVEGVGKRYRLYEKSSERLKDALLPFHRPSEREFWALRDISFEVGRGKALGIIGRNGCGKSTLLQIVCGILKPSAGCVNVRGRISALLELGAGFHPEYTGRSNVWMNLALTGFNRAQIESRLPIIEEFADIGEFIDQPVRIYSSGMFVRLAFACAVAVEPEILVVDEALSVGDIFFQQKCFAKIRDIMAGGATCLFVSHDATALLNLCTEILFLEEGRAVFLGAPEEAVSRYYSSIGTRVARTGRPQVPPRSIGASGSAEAAPTLKSAKDILENNILSTEGRRHGARGLEILALSVTDREGRKTLSTEILGALCFHLLIQAHENVAEPGAGINLYDRFGNLVFAAGTFQLRVQLPPLAAGEYLIATLELKFSVQPGEYTFSVGAGEPAAEDPNVGYIHDRREMLGPVVVSADRGKVFPFYGIAQLPMRVCFCRPATLGESS